MDCIGVIPTNPDISGVGVRAAIYIQNFLSFLPALWALRDGKISSDELEAVERQSTTILITAFAILISTLIQLKTYGLSAFHTSIILNLSWINNTNAFIYFILYIQYKCDGSRGGHGRIQPSWTAWIKHGRHVLLSKRTYSLDGETGHLVADEKEEEAYGTVQHDNKSEHTWAVYVSQLIRVRLYKWMLFAPKKGVLVLASLHLTLMSAIGIWLWASPVVYEQRQPKLLASGSSILPIYCTSLDVIGQDLSFTSSLLQKLSLVIYSCFLMPGLNLLLPVAFFLLLKIGLGRKRDESSSAKSSTPKRDWTVLWGLGFLLVVDFIFLIDTEITLSRAKRAGSQMTDESEWTFGQTLALLLLVLPLRDVYEYMIGDATATYAKWCTERLKDAVKNGEQKKVRKYARYADNVQVRMDGEFPSPLHYAAYIGDLKLVRLLLERQAYLDVQGESHGTPLVVAASQKHEDVVRRLIESEPGATLRLTDKHGKTALHYAAQHGLEQIVNLSLSHGAEPNLLSKDGRTLPLHLAFAHGSEAVVMPLLEAHAKAIQDSDENGHGSASWIARVLQEGGVDVDRPLDDQGSTALLCAARDGRESVVELLLACNARINHAGKDGTTPLRCAARNGHELVVGVLLDGGAAVDKAASDGMTPLMLASQKGHTSVVEVLLERNADINYAAEDGTTALMYAVMNGHHDVVRRSLGGDGHGGLTPHNHMLTDPGVEARVNQTTRDGETRLICAVHTGQPSREDDLMDSSTSIHRSRASQNIQQLQNLWSRLRGNNAQASKPVICDMVRLLLNHGAGIDQTASNGYTALIWAAKRGLEDVARLLIDRGASVNRADHSGKTPLMHAAREGHIGLATCLLNNKADVNQASGHGSTALLYAVRGEHEKMVRLLLEHGADYTMVNAKGETAESIARSIGNEAIMAVVTRAQSREPGIRFSFGTQQS